PVELWPLPSDQFGRDLNFIRVNTQQNWVLSKPTLGVIRLRPQVALILPLLVLLVGCQAAANPLNFTGPEFLTFYIVLIVVGLPLAFWLRNYLRQPDGDPRRPFLKLNDYETAYLAGGAGRVVDTAIASLVQQRSVKVLPSGILSLEQSVNPSRSFVEKSVAAEIEGDQPLWQIQQTAEKKTGSIRDRLVQLGLVLTQAQAQKARLYPILLLLTLLGLGVAKIAVGLSREKPVSFLIFLCFVVTVWGLGLFKALPQRTRYGDRVLADLRDRFQRSNISSDDPQLPLLFALFGPEILVGSPFTDLESVFPVYSSRGGSDSGGGGIGGGGDSGGSSGCGGGGCGGCGGCGS
ncbi:MAG TPA: TIGR04222 domain-containing membrane protein, partial [Thermosynechococcaceae cyanobacterium]